MAGINADYVNPFIIAATKVLKDVCFIDIKVGKPSIRKVAFNNNTYAIMLGITGEMGGQVMIAFENNIACEIASKMCMMPITLMDDIAISAISELGNMVMGNAATVLSAKGIIVDITPPTVAHGDVMFEINFAKNLCIPLSYENKVIELNLAIKD